MLTPDKFKNVRGNLLSIVKRQTSVTTKADLGDKTTLAQLNNASSTLENDTLKVLVMGTFNAGKSTLLNALMGKMIMPMDAIPTTAVIGEIVYADEPQAVLYPKPGYSGGTEPFEVKIEDLEQYVVIDHSQPQKDEVKQPNPFQKVVVKYPLSICKHGIMLIDSPGLDDPTCHDVITKDYLPNADAIVFCMPATGAYTNTQKVEIERLVSLGYKSIIFVLTRFDEIQRGDEMMGTNQAEKTRKHLTQTLSQYTDLGASGIFFVSSLDALVGKQKGDQQRLEKSNFPVLERRVEEILFNEKGKMKLHKALYSTKRVNRKTGLHLNDLFDAANSDKIRLSERIIAAQNSLRQANGKAYNMFKSFKTCTDGLVNGAKDRGRLFLLNDIIPNIPEWVAEFEPAEEQSISMWHPKRSCTAFGEACGKYVQKRIEASVATWCQEEFAKNYLQPQLDTFVKQQELNLNAFENDLSNVRASLNLALDGNQINVGAGDGNRFVAALASAVFLNPASMIAGATFGVSGVVTSLATLMAESLLINVLGIAISWPVVIIAWLGSIVITGEMQKSQLENKLRKRVAAELTQMLTNAQNQFSDDIGNRVGEIVAKMQDAVKDELFAPVNQLQKAVELAQERDKGESASLQQKIATCVQLRNENVRIADDMDDFAADVFYIF